MSTPLSRRSTRQRGDIVRNTSGQVYAVGDTAFAAPLTVTDLAGIPMTTVDIGDIPITEQFQIDDQPQVVWKSGAYILTLWSPLGLLNEATSARQTAETIQAQLADAPQILPAGGNNGDVLYRIADRTGQWAPAAQGTGGTGGGITTWDAILSKPATFPASPHTHPAAEISDATTVGRAVVQAASQQAARAAIGAGTGNGTSDLQLGSTATTAAAGNHSHAATALTFAPTGALTATDVQAAIVQASLSGGGSGVSAIYVWRYTAGAWPTIPTVRPNGVMIVMAIGPSFPTTVPGWVGLAANQAPLKFEKVSVA
jgi:hypothetical protein